MTRNRRVPAVLAGSLVLGLAALAPAAEAATLPVTSVADSGPGSLREQMAAAGPLDVVSLPDPRTLTPSASSYVLQSELVVKGKSVTVRGAGARNVVIDANGTGRVFSLQGVNTVYTALDLSGVTVTGGRLTTGKFGGGINVETLTALSLENAVVRGNVIDTPSESGWGGGIAVGPGAQASINRSLIADNVANANTGAGTDGYGGGIWAGGSTTLYNSTLTGNSIVADPGTSVRGGGIAVTGSAHAASLIGSTVARNVATGAGALGGNLAAGGGSDTSIQYVSSIVAGGVAPGGTGNCWGDAAELVGGGGTVFAEAGGCPVAFTDDPKLDTELRDNGGPTDTLRIAPTSAAVDRVAPQDCSILTADQRGFARPSGTSCDAGAYEQSAPTAGLAVVPTVGTTTATVTGTVGRQGPGGTARVEYGTAPDALTSRSPDQAIATGTGDVPVSAALTGLSAATTYHYRVVVDTPDGTAASSVGTFRTEAAPGPGGPGGPGNPGGPGGPGGPGSGEPVPPKAPVLSALKLTPKSWRTKKGAKKGGRITFSLANGPAPVTFTVERAVRGKKRGRACVAPPKRGPYRRCTRYVPVKGALRTTGRTGANALTWNGRLGGKALKRGSYRLVAVVRASSDASQVARTGFRVR